jgi:predicted HicB family RNase H-like nuclease
MPEKRLKIAQINWRVRPELKTAAEIAAKADNRTLTSLIEKLLTDYLKKKGFLK